PRSTHLSGAAAAHRGPGRTAARTGRDRQRTPAIGRGVAHPSSAAGSRAVARGRHPGRHRAGPAATGELRRPRGADASRPARLAMASAPPATVAVQQFDATPLGALVAADPETSSRVARTILGGLLTIPAEERATLMATLDAWFDALGSAAEAG